MCLCGSMHGGLVNNVSFAGSADNSMKEKLQYIWEKAFECVFTVAVASFHFKNQQHMLHAHKAQTLA